MNQKNLATTSRFLAWKTQCKHRRRSRGNFSRNCFGGRGEWCAKYNQRENDSWLSA